MKYRKVIFILLLLCFTGSFASGVYVGKLKGFPFVRKQFGWSIGIYTGESPFNLTFPKNIKNPVLTAKDVTDVPAEFVADPFMVKNDSGWYMFFEVMNARTDQGDIGLAISNDGLSWTYEQIILDESFHLSYPYVFKWKNEYYMIPASHQAYSIRLYKAVVFPAKWSYVKTLIHRDCVDSSILCYNDKWWIFTADRDDVLCLYYANNLMGPWIEHPKSPIIAGNANIARPGGRVLIYDGRIFRYAQDDVPVYGNQVWMFEITELTTASYAEKKVDENPVLKASGDGWNAEGMHHIDPHQIDENRWIACVDGYRKILLFGSKY